jgi:hypothetical protein
MALKDVQVTAADADTSHAQQRLVHPRHRHGRVRDLEQSVPSVM